MFIRRWHWRYIMISYATHEEEVEEVEKGKTFVCVSQQN
jgi:hypothetical protein